MYIVVGQSFEKVHVECVHGKGIEKSELMMIVIVIYCSPNAYLSNVLQVLSRSAPLSCT